MTVLDPSFAPPGETANDIWIEKSNLNGVILACVGYGILFTLSVQCLLILLKPRRGQPIKWWVVIYIACMFSMATIGLAANVKFNEMTYIDNRNMPGGPNAFTVVFYTYWVNLMGFIVYTIMSWAADGLLLYRFLVIYSIGAPRYAILALPVLIYLGIIASSLGLIVSMTRVSDTFWASTVARFAVAYWSLSVSLNILLTILIAGRLLYVRRSVLQVSQSHGANYVSTAAMLVESASLYSIFALAFIITYARQSYVQNILLPPLGQVQGIAPMLILLRVLKGRAWSQETTTDLKTAHFASGTERSRSNFTSIPLSSMKTHSTKTTTDSLHLKLDNEDVIRIGVSTGTSFSGDSNFADHKNNQIA